MAMSKSVAQDVFKELYPDWIANQATVDVIDKWYRGEQDVPVLPNTGTAEFRELQRRSVTPWPALVVTAVAQSLYVDGYRKEREDANAPVWDVWQLNGLDARQLAVHRGALAHGIAYVTVIPGDMRGQSVPHIRGRSARVSVAFYEDVAADEWPAYFLLGEPLDPDGGLWRFKLWDETEIHTIDYDNGTVSWIDVETHDVGVCPVIRYANQLDLDGRSPGEVAPLIPLAARIDQDTFDRLLVQRLGSWPVRYGTGLQQPTTDEEKRAFQQLMTVGDFLISSDPQTKFGTLAAAPLDGYINAKDADIRDLAAVSQTPPHYLLGQVANLSAEALQAAEAALSRKNEERKHSFGESHEQTLRLADEILGNAPDFSAQVRWRDMESRSLAATADALGKLAQMLGVPVQALWERVPGVTQQDIDLWKELAERDDALGGLVDQLAGGLEPSEDDPAETKAKADAMGVLIRAGVNPLDAAARVGFDGLKFTGAVPTSLRVPESQAGALEE